MAASVSIYRDDNTIQAGIKFGVEQGASAIIPLFGGLMSILEAMSIIDPEFNPEKVLEDGDAQIIVAPSSYKPGTTRRDSFSQEKNYYRDGIFIFTEPEFGGDIIYGPAYEYDPAEDALEFLKELGIDGLLKVAS